MDTDGRFTTAETNTALSSNSNTYVHMCVYIILNKKTIISCNWKLV